ncbi:MAG: hypothetical protein AB7T37_16210 [Dehalococcoidia bacterium]
MEKAISTVLLTIASVVAMLVVISAVMPSVGRTTGAITSASSALDDRIKADIEIIHATGEDANFDAFVWVKNIGASNLIAIERTDIFFGEDSNFQRIPYGGPGCAAPCWEATIENATSWEPTSTLGITIHLDAALTAGSTYYVKVVLYNGTSDARYFTL